MRGIFHRVEVIEVAKELIKSMHRGEELIEIAQVILPELSGGIAHGLEHGGDGRRGRRHADLGARLADCRHAGADGQLAGDEVRATRRATCLGIVVGEKHAALGKFIEVRCSARHHASAVSADVPNADVIAHDEDDVWLFVLRLRQHRDKDRTESDSP